MMTELINRAFRLGQTTMKRMIREKLEDPRDKIDEIAAPSWNEWVESSF